MDIKKQKASLDPKQVANLAKPTPKMSGQCVAKLSWMGSKCHKKLFWKVGSVDQNSVALLLKLLGLGVVSSSKSIKLISLLN